MGEGAAPHVSAQEITADPIEPPRPIQDAIGAAVQADTADSAPALPARVAPRDRRRPSALVPLYISYGALQALDFHSTRRAIGNDGAVEANPVMKGIVGNSAAFLAVKAAGTAGVVFTSEKLRKEHAVAAVIFMAAANSWTAWVVRHNYRAGRR